MHQNTSSRTATSACYNGYVPPDASMKEADTSPATSSWFAPAEEASKEVARINFILLIQLGYDCSFSIYPYTKTVLGIPTRNSKGKGHREGSARSAHNHTHKPTETPNTSTSCPPLSLLPNQPTQFPSSFRFSQLLSSNESNQSISPSPFLERLNRRASPPLVTFRIFPVASAPRPS